ncbi:MAG: LPXTG cell wall anchor domain-containing protein [Microthrixaceae bacterium]|nr:LPXTG cell wall anchor domain-containing protein [Acidimicrobiales bacterium]MCB9404608.1 LPXTG cell wall anchor domain-containing protein [Microthrixaceae bacterium]
MSTLHTVRDQRGHMSRRGRIRPRGVPGWASRVIFAVVLLTVVLGEAPAEAEPVLVVSPASGLDPAAAFVVVSGTGYLPNTQLFVMQCRGNSTDDHSCNSVGLRKVTTDASGSFTADAMRLVSRFGATDCTVEQCAVMTSAVSGHSDDRSQDRSTPIYFAAAPQTTVAPPPETIAPSPDTAPPTTPGSTTPPPVGPIAPVVPEATTATTTTATDPEPPAGDDGATTRSPTRSRAVAPTGDPETQDDGTGGSGAVVVAGAGVAVAAAGAAGVVAVRRRRNGS